MRFLFGLEMSCLRMQYGFLVNLFCKDPRQMASNICSSFVYYSVCISIFNNNVNTESKSELLMEEFADIHQIERSIEAFAHGTYGEIFM